MNGWIEYEGVLYNLNQYSKVSKDIHCFTVTLMGNGQTNNEYLSFDTEQKMKEAYKLIKTKLLCPHKFVE